MLAKVLSSAVLGGDAYLVAGEVGIALGVPTFNTVLRRARLTAAR